MVGRVAGEERTVEGRLGRRRSLRLDPEPPVSQDLLADRVIGGREVTRWRRHERARGPDPVVDRIGIAIADGAQARELVAPYVGVDQGACAPDIELCREASRATQLVRPSGHRSLSVEVVAHEGRLSAVRASRSNMLGGSAVGRNITG